MPVSKETLRNRFLLSFHILSISGTIEGHCSKQSSWEKMFPNCQFSSLDETPSATKQFIESKIEYQWLLTILQLSIHLDVTSKPVQVLTPQILRVLALESAEKSSHLGKCYDCSSKNTLFINTDYIEKLSVQRQFVSKKHNFINKTTANMHNEFLTYTDLEMNDLRL